VLFPCLAACFGFVLSHLPWVQAAVQTSKVWHVPYIQPADAAFRKGLVACTANFAVLDFDMFLYKV